MQFTCEACGSQVVRWSARCGKCGAWDKLLPVIAEPHSLRADVDPQPRSILTPLSRIPAAPRESIAIDPLLSIVTHIPRGASYIIGGGPGAGKSTFALRCADSLDLGQLAAIFSGEETLEQIRMRADRLKIVGDNIVLANDTSAEVIIQEIVTRRPRLTVIDSLQTISAESFYESIYDIVHANKTVGGVLLLVGQVNRDGEVAGPRAIEHLVDCVMYAENHGNGTCAVAATKNRFGPVGVTGRFALT